MNIEQETTKTLYQRRKEERPHWTKLFLDAEPNYWVTLTFNDTKHGTPISPQFAQSQATYFHKKLCRQLLGRKWAQRDWPTFIGFFEYGGDGTLARTPHYHFMAWLNDEHATKVKDQNSMNNLWIGINPKLHRSIDIKKNDTYEALSNRARYLTKRYALAPLDYEFLILGK